MNRREFIKGVTLGSTAGLILPAQVYAAVQDNSMAGGLFYTKESPGRWAGKEAGHMPVVTRDKNKVKVVTPHEMKGYEHYIVKHLILDKEFKFLTEKVFNPKTDASPVSEHDLGSYQGKIHVLSVCNLHDSWLAIA